MLEHFNLVNEEEVTAYLNENQGLASSLDLMLTLFSSYIPQATRYILEAEAQQCSLGESSEPAINLLCYLDTPGLDLEQATAAIEQLECQEVWRTNFAGKIVLMAGAILQGE